MEGRKCTLWFYDKNICICIFSLSKSKIWIFPKSESKCVFLLQKVLSCQYVAFQAILMVYYITKLESLFYHPCYIKTGVLNEVFVMKSDLI